jgi:hypothetical protein
MLLAKRYNLFPGFFAESPTGLDLLLIDHVILNRCIDEENKAQEAMQKDRKEERDHPGMKRNKNIDEFWDQVDEINGEG